MLAVIDIIFWTSIKILGILGASVGILIFVLMIVCILKFMSGR